MFPKIRVGIVDDHPLFREGLAHTLERYGDFEIVGTGGSADEAVRMAQSLRPDVMVCDICMPGGGLAAVEEIAATGSGKVLVLSMKDDTETVSAALGKGAFGYLLKGSGGVELASAIRAIHQGDRYLTPSLAVQLLSRSAIRTAEPPVRDPLAGLTQRESQVLSIMVEGRSNKEIGNKLALSEKTIKHHVTRILQKLSVRNRVEAVLMASRRRQNENRVN
ncbi:LuxR C-terminal-related transcriptional regulator [Microvirga pudoricolor]|uniref:LuxR C-terminal-related transcriptional regulator n=1 Tax=Microvirga pudoricolor TaxID=2778729 RepID=UPI001950AA0D|nr:response regulator transcription factor [Microvirga pudoricolor]MBM6596406.1 response regulator transcription factor [Microvirga pudoricolor]